MIQLSDQEVLALRARAQRHPELIEKMKQDVSELMNEPVLAPETGVANWSHYYYCADCSVQLRFDRHAARLHTCPQCGRIYTGEPYDGAWWQLVNSSNDSGAIRMGWIYAMTGDISYARKAAEILCTYARYYPNYQVHGDIPYNGPGRAGAQTLDEANFQRSLAVAYDLVQDVLTQEERALIRDNMLLPGAQFLTEHRHNQMHNHEVIVNSAIAIIGLIFDRQDLIDFALYTPYGIVYQLEHGMLENGMWFEGSFGYHFYALTSFFAYEKFAIHTKHSHIRHPNYEKMMTMAYDYLQPDGELPMLGDTKPGNTLSSLLHYEFAYRELRHPKMLALLYACYKNRARDNLEALIYGVEELPPCPEITREEYVHPQPGRSGHTLLRGDQGRYLLFKHDRYGGEHDHYDRLGISYLALGQSVAPDLGTTGYGAVLHYDYYKNTGTHNTVMIGEENQSPANAVLTRCEKRDVAVFVEAECDFGAQHTLPDSFTIVQWDEAAYRRVRMTRRIVWMEDCFAEAFFVDGVEENRTIDWIWHVDGARQTLAGETAADAFSDKKPFKHLHDVKMIQNAPALTHTWVKDGATTRVHSADFSGDTYLTVGPHNPSYREISYLIERARGERAVFAHAIETYRGAPVIKSAAFERAEGHIIANLSMTDGTRRRVEL